MMHAPRARVRRPRSAGVLLHPTSLPGPFGVGDIGPEAVRFLDWLTSGSQKVWQVLPLNPPGYGNSPYGCLSSFAGNPLLISPESLIDEGLLPVGAVDALPQFDASRVDFPAVAAWKELLLRQSHQHFLADARPELEEELESFQSAPEQAGWLDDWSLYVALKHRFNQIEWSAWERDYALRNSAALASARRDLAGEIALHKYVQFLFFRQWRQLLAAAHARGIRIMGDVPIYAAGDSADVWSHTDLFQLDAAGRPTAVAGVPPDYFSATGQRWGNPLYRWDRMAEDGFQWWIERVRANLRLVDILRLDHFRGFSAYWEVAAEEPTAMHGRWVNGPGKALFDAIRGALGSLPLVAEDLGFITTEVDELRTAAGLPGMKILQFAFEEEDSPHLPHNYEPASVVYTGTHDNDTARGWFTDANAVEKAHARSYLGCAAEEIQWGMIRMAYTSVADMAIVPLQDILGVGSEGRMNRPGYGENNWAWRYERARLTQKTAELLTDLATVAGRG
jgi:4-alpha-glucanotransferase